ncbi:MAG: HpcH/HpaI aldolase/citrate lyase family protein, partial [Caldilineaceae bacterium]|nr:HpcH/HpaI aldolase/citrate lyase family protein [Caldilineaceae bacterium]
ARSALVMAATAYGLQAIDTVFVDLTDLDGLAEECAFARQLGFVGKMAIHPRQTPVMNRAFSPTEAEVSAAQRLVELFTARQGENVGVFELDGKMVDMPMMRAAMRVLARAGMMLVEDGNRQI